MRKEHPDDIRQAEIETGKAIYEEVKLNAAIGVSTTLNAWAASRLQAYVDSLCTS